MITRNIGRCLYTLHSMRRSCYIACKQMTSTRKQSDQASIAKKTCLHDFHIKHGGKMVTFGGWDMPVQYTDLGIPASHLHTRSSVSIFDVSHMLQTKIHGKDRVAFLESLVVADVAGLKDNQGTLTLFTNPQGGIMDDLIVTRTPDDYLYVVSNAGCSEKDFHHLMSNAKEFQSKGHDVQVQAVCNGLIAVQGPRMVQALQPGLNFDLSDLPFMMSMTGSVFGVPDCRVTRCGYTGEDGVEISIPADRTEFVTESLLDSKDADVALAGLGARDSLRLEAGLCLYGSDIDETTTPAEATLAWTIAKRRRQSADFPGASIILQQLKEKPKKKRVGFLSAGPPARGGTAIFDETGAKQVGQITSGCPSPSLKKNISMGYVETAYSKNGTKLKFEIRKKQVDAEVTKMPFVPANYYMGKS